MRHTRFFACTILLITATCALAQSGKPPVPGQTVKYNYVPTASKYVDQARSAQAGQLQQLNSVFKMYDSAFQAGGLKTKFDTAGAAAALKSRTAATDLDQIRSQAAKWTAQFGPGVAQAFQASGVNVEELRQRMILAKVLRPEAMPAGAGGMEERPHGSKSTPPPPPGPRTWEQVLQRPYQFNDLSSNQGFFYQHADLEWGQILVSAACLVACSVGESALLGSSFTIPAGLSSVTVRTELSADWVNNASVAFGYANAEVLSVMRVMDGGREVCNVRSSLDHITLVGFGDVSRRSPGLSEWGYVSCTFPNNPSAPHSYAVVAGFETWAGGGGPVMSAQALINGRLEVIRIRADQ